MFGVEREPEISEKTALIHLLTVPFLSRTPSQAVHLCRVNNRLVGVPASPVRAELPTADAIVVRPGAADEIIVKPLSPEQDFTSRLIIAGCDPAMPLVAKSLFKNEGVEAIVAGCSSLQALNWLKEKRIHIAGTHLRSQVSEGSTLAVVEKVFPRGGYRVVTFSSWEEGFVVASGNPKRIRSVRDLSGRGLTIVNREIGSGSRFLLDSLLRQEGISGRIVRGYRNMVDGHILAAWHVQSGQADCCVATRAAARVFSLDFIPLVVERYDLVIPEQFWDLPAVQAVLAVLNRSSMKRVLESLGGYDTSQMGRIVC
jgi:molybdate-binding protein